MAKPRLNRATHLILDYDGTLTVKDTMAVLGSLPKQPTTTWQGFVDAYMTDYQTHKNASFTWKEYDREEYSKWLATRRWVEVNSAQRVQDAGFFRGVTLDQVHQSVDEALSGGTLQLRDGWMKLFDLFLPHYCPRNGRVCDSNISVLSVNWSETAIRRALWTASSYTDHIERETLCKYIYDIEVHANELQGLESPYGSTGRVCRPWNGDIRTSDDKLRRLPKGRNGGGPLTVYVGDSSTDFDCLCAADVGVWLCHVPESDYAQIAKDTFRPLNFAPPPLRTISSLTEAGELFYWAPSFEVLLQLLTSE